MKNEGKTALAHLTASAEKEFCAFLAQQTPEAYEDAVALIEECRAAGRRVHVTGIGKPGHVAGYGASLLSSTGTPSYFLHGTEAVHGSCGQLEEGDVVIAISNSGETVELKATVLAVKNNGCRVIGITGNAESWLAKESDALLLAHVDEEGGPLRATPCSRRCSCCRRSPPYCRRTSRRRPRSMSAATPAARSARSAITSAEHAGIPHSAGERGRTMKNVTSDKRNLWMFPLGTVGRDMIYNLFTNFIFTYILFTRHLTAAQLGAVTAIMVGARVFDALNDPVMGNIIERTRSRYGKFKPWLVIGILSTSVVVYLAFNTSLQGWSFIAFFGVIYFLYSITYTMHDISYWGMVSALSSDPHVRNSLTSRTNLFAGIGGVIASILIPMLTTGSGTLGGSTATAYGRVALVICILAPLFLCATIFGVRERRDYNTKEVPPVSFKKIWNTITGNPQILWISLVFLLQQIGNDVVMGGLGSTYVYFAFGYEGGLYSLFNTVGLAATALLMIFYPMLAKRFRRKQMMDKLMLLSVIGYAVMIVSGLALSGGMVKFWILTAGYMVANLGQYGFYLIMMISLINTVEYNEYLRGERDEAIITSLRPFFTKLASAIVVAVTSATYLIFGVTGYTNRISALERAASLGEIAEAEKLAQIDTIVSSIQPGQSRGLLLCLTVLPFVLMYASYVLYKKHYILDEDKYAEVCAELEKRRAEAK